MKKTKAKTFIRTSYRIEREQRKFVQKLAKAWNLNESQTVRTILEAAKNQHLAYL